MKLNLVAWGLLSFLLLTCWPFTAHALNAPEVGAAAAVLIDAETGKMLYRKAMDEPRPMASTTKVMTAMLALELTSMDEQVEVGSTVLEIIGSNVGLKPGATISMKNLLACLLLSSGNDAAVAIAEHISGSVEDFAALMNARAAQLGALNTHFVNPHGLHHDDHYASAYDLALITRAAFQYPLFEELVGARTVEVELPDSPDNPVQLINHNRLLWRADYADGVKTGYVRAAGRCLIASGSRSGWRLIAVVLNSPDTYADSQALLEYGFNNYHRYVYARPGDAMGRARVKGGNRAHVPALSQDSLTLVVGPATAEPRIEVTLANLKAPVEEGEQAGEARLLLDDEVVASSPLVAGEAVGRNWFMAIVIWLLRLAIIAGLLLLVTRNYGKFIKAHRRRRHSLPT